MIIMLSPQEIIDCWRYGVDCAQSYLDGKKEVSRLRGIHEELDEIYAKPPVHANAKGAEVATCIALGRDPKILDWQTTRTDGGTDFIHRGMRIDVKGTPNRNYKYLIWPIGKEFDEYKFDILIFVRGNLDINIFDVVGWIKKKDYKKHAKICQTERGQFPRLAKGTMYLDVSRRPLIPVEHKLRVGGDAMA